MYRRLTAIDLLSLAFLTLLLAVAVAAASVLPHAGWLVARLLGLAAAIVALSRSAAHPAAGYRTRLFHAFLPVLVVPVLFDTMGDLIPWVRSRTYDDLLIAADQWLFGGHHPTVLLERFVHPVLTTIMQLAYIGYYPMAVVLGAALWAKKNKTAFDEAIFGILLCFYLSYLGYLLFPAVGPRFTLAALQGRDLAAGPFVMAIQDTLNALENTKTDAFPSGHTAIALMTLCYARKFRLDTLSALLVPAVTGLILSTVYLRYHYVVDVLAGVVLAVFTLYLAPPLFSLLSRASADLRDQLHRSA